VCKQRGQSISIVQQREIVVSNSFGAVFEAQYPLLQVMMFEIMVILTMQLVAEDLVSLHVFYCCLMGV
jgi:hypothetical protein